MEWQIATQTHRGNVRRINEDALLVEKHGPLFVVADGMGGHEAGDVASRMLVDDMASLVIPPTHAEAVALINTSILGCNRKLIDYARRKLPGQLVGTTVVTMLADHVGGSCLWAGDSRLYRMRGQQLEQMTADHSYVDELVRSGKLSAEAAINHPSSNMITRAVGTSAELQLDSVTFDVELEDTFLLCSDGLYNEVDSGELSQSLSAEDIWQSSNQLLNLCLSRKARDNITFIIARPVAAGEDDFDATLTYYPQQD